ncbi:glycosyltransferase [Roseomonas sp. BN140053]|uniref:glycosyltransferase n=1 Tax=Roseomonas sp. BN140053 TaxID=3391898 RepID=UPI0039EC8BE5
MTTPSIIVDARCLQDPQFRERGIGQHAEALLRHRPRGPGAPRLVALLDPALPRLLPRLAVLFDAERVTAYEEPAGTGWFLSLSPMTHDPLRVARLLTRPGRRRAAIIYDFIPLDMPGTYLRGEKARLDYHAGLAWLGAYDLFLPISRATAGRLHAVTGTAEGARSVTTGVAVRGALVPEPDLPPAKLEHLLVVAGPDPRKNIEVALRAHARSAPLQRRGVPLLVAGAYPPSLQEKYREEYEREAGDPELLRFLPHLSDAELQRNYRAAFATVAPSRLEGFSIPIVEASANASPVLAADCPAQAELVADPGALFEPEDADRLGGMMERMVADPAARAALQAQQGALWRRFTESAVAERFWRAIAEAPPASPAVSRRARPRIAIMTPMPPDRSGVADFSFATVAPLARMADTEVFTAATAPRIPEGAAFRPISALPHLSGRYDRVVSVAGNSYFHDEIVGNLLDYGGACIAHDARMLHFYLEKFGRDRTLALARSETGRAVRSAELDLWAREQWRMQALFLKEIAAASQPLFVHSLKLRDIVGELYGTRARYLPFALLRSFVAEEVQRPSRAAARRALGVAADELLVIHLGFVADDKAPEDLVWAQRLLHDWGYRLRLVFVGLPNHPAVEAHLNWLAGALDLGGRVTITGSVAEAEWRRWLLAADAAVQLRTYRFGQISGALQDCIAAGLPAVANADLADSLGGPDFVRQVPDQWSPTLIAELLAPILDRGPLAPRDEAQRAAYSAEHEPAVYAAHLLRGLDLEVAS